MRSSWEASATNRRSRSSDSSRSANDASMRSSIVVEGHAEVPDLGLRVPDRHPVGQVAGGDGIGRRDHVLERTKALADDPDHEHGEGAEHDGGGDDLHRRRAASACPRRR